MEDTSNQSLVFIIDRLNVTKLTSTACLSLFAYDYLITFSQEVEFFWNRRPLLSTISVLYFLNRYLPPVAFLFQFIVLHLPEITSQLLCKIAKFTDLSTQIFILLIVQYVLMSRVRSLFNDCRMAVTCALIVLYVCSSTVASVLLIKTHGDWLPTAFPATGCTRPVDFSNTSYFIVLLAVETIMFITTAIRSYQFHVTANGCTPTLHALLTHGSIYYACIMTVLAICITSTFIPYLRGPIIASDFIIFALSISCTRLMLSLHGTIAHQHCPDGTATSMLATSSSYRENGRTNRNSSQFTTTVPYTEEPAPLASPKKDRGVYGLYRGIKNTLRRAPASERRPNIDRSNFAERPQGGREDSDSTRIGGLDFEIAETLNGSVENLSPRTLRPCDGSVDPEKEMTILSRIDSGVHESVYCWPTPPPRIRTPSRASGMSSRTETRPPLPSKQRSF